MDAARESRLRAGLLPIVEPGLDALMDEHRATRRLHVAGDYEAVHDADVVFIAVPTPSRPDGRVDISLVEQAVRAVLLRAHEAVIAIKSTVPPGTTARLEALACSLGAPDARFVANPEFLREGQAVHDFLNPDRIVIGTRDHAAGDLVAALYERLHAHVYRTAPEDAELAKYASNALLAARISFMNEIAGIADSVGADVTQVASMVGADAGIGGTFLNAGLGCGGSCFPKDVAGLAALARDVGASSVMLEAVLDANEDARARAVAVVLEATRGIPMPVVGLLGLAFKPGTDDARESPKVAVASALANARIAVRTTDPSAAQIALRLEHRLQIVSSVRDAALGADVLVLATEWPAFIEQDWNMIARVMRGHVVLDARNVLDADAIRAAGLTYRSLGRDILGRRARANREEVACVS